MPSIQSPETRPQGGPSAQAPPRPARSAQAQWCLPACTALGGRRGTAFLGGARVRLELDEFFGHLVIAALRQDAHQKSPDTPGSLEGNTEGPGTASSEPPLPS